MKAVVFHGIGGIRLDTVKEPAIKHEFDAIVRLTASAICGTDLHFVRGTVPGMQEGTILGHEGVGVVEEIGKSVRNLKPGDRVVIPSTIARAQLHPLSVEAQLTCASTCPGVRKSSSWFLRHVTR